MEFLKLTIHQIIKQQGIAQTELIPSNSLNAIDENVETLIEKLNEAFSKDEKVIKTDFVDQQREFQTSIRTFNQDRNDVNFFAFSESSVGRINDLLTGANLATGGYFVYSNYIYRNRSYASVFLVRDTEEIIFDRSPDGNSFVINKTTVINTRNLAMAVRVDLNKLLNQEERCVHFTFRQSDVSEYFVTWIEIHLSNKSKEDTVTLVNLINSIDPYPIDPETNSPYEREKFRNKVFDYVQSTGRVVKLSDLSHSFWGNRNFLSNLAEEKGIEIDDEFRADSAVLRRLKKYRIVSGKITLGFSKSDIDQGRLYAGDENQIVLDNAILRRKFDNLDA